MALLDDLPEDLKPLFEEEQNRTNLERLVLQVQSSITPFIGAGLSFDFGYKLWGAFLSSSLKAAGGRLVAITGRKPDWYVQVEDDLKNYRYEEAADQLYGRNCRGFNDAVTATFGPLQFQRVPEGNWDDPAHAVFYLPELSDGPVITTNFDEVLEEVFRRNGKAFETVVMGAQAAAVQRQTDVNGRFLLKLHGGYYADQNRVLTKEEYAEAYGSANAGEVNEKKPLPALLAKLLENRPFLFIGCSLYQDRTLVVAQRAARYRGGTRHFAILEDMPLDESYVDRTPELNDKEIAPIFYPAGQHDLVPKLLAYLVKKRAEMPRRAAPSHIRLAPCEAENQIRRYTCGFQSQLSEYSNHWKMHPGRSRLYLLHGKEEDCIDSLIERLVRYETRKVVMRVQALTGQGWLGEDSVENLSPVESPWSDTGNVQERMVRIASELYDKLVQLGGGGFNFPFPMGRRIEAETLQAIARELQKPVVVIRHDLRKEQWDHQMLRLLREYLTYWSPLTQSVELTGQTIMHSPQFLIYLVVTMPPPAASDNPFLKEVEVSLPRLTNWAKTEQYKHFCDLQKIDLVQQYDIRQWLKELRDAQIANPANPQYGYWRTNYDYWLDKLPQEFQACSDGMTMKNAESLLRRIYCEAASWEGV